MKSRSQGSELVRRTLLVDLAGAGIAGIAGTPIAQAASLGTTTLSNKGQGYGSWTYDAFNGTRYRISGTTRDFVAGGNSIYFSAQTQKSSGTCYAASNDYMSGSCSQDFDKLNTVRGTDFNSPEWRTAVKYSPFSTTSKGHRANLRVCENQKLRTDPCSNWWISPSSYWFG